MKRNGWKQTIWRNRKISSNNGREREKKSVSGNIKKKICSLQWDECGWAEKRGSQNDTRTENDDTKITLMFCCLVRCEVVLLAHLPLNISDIRRERKKVCFVSPNDSISLLRASIGMPVIQPGYFSSFYFLFRVWNLPHFDGSIFPFHLRDSIQLALMRIYHRNVTHVCDSMKTLQHFITYANEVVWLPQN